MDERNDAPLSMVKENEKYYRKTGMENYYLVVVKPGSYIFPHHTTK